MSSSQLERVVTHAGRLDVLCCLLDGGPLSVAQLAARIGKSSKAVRYWASMLDSFDLVEKQNALNNGEPLYEAKLDDHPEWVQEAIREHRPRAL